MNNEINGKTFDHERALYNLQDTLVSECTFAGEADGESVLKESNNIVVKNCTFSLRYPLWHSHNFKLLSSDMDDKTRAPIWYAEHGTIEKCKIEGIKCLRECANIKLIESKVISKEFGWKCSEVEIKNCEMESEYFLFESKNVKIDNLKMNGKYSFQYMENVNISNSYLDTKDAFWHGKNMTIENSVVKGEYLGWYSQGLTFINCKIIGTQPLCYCKDLKLINCTMDDTDLSFEYSEVNADICGNILSVKNPKSGKITTDGIGELIYEDSIMKSECEIIIRK